MLNDIINICMTQQTELELYKKAKRIKLEIPSEVMHCKTCGYPILKNPLELCIGCHSDKTNKAKNA